MAQQSPYELLGKEEGVRKLANAVYEAMDELPEAETIRKMHDDSLSDIKQKLFEYLNGWLGGPHLYKEKYGKICLMDQHKPFPIGEAERDQWLLCFDKALEKIDAPQEVRDMVRQPILNLADFIVNQR